MKWLPVALLASLFACGCTPIERDAYNIIVGSKAFITAEVNAYPECKDPANYSLALCIDLTKATKAKDVMIDLLEVYCSSPGFDAGTASCSPPNDPAQKNQLANKLKAAISIYAQAESDLRGAIK